MAGNNAIQILRGESVFPQTTLDNYKGVTFLEGQLVYDTKYHYLYSVVKNDNNNIHNELTPLNTPLIRTEISNVRVMAYPNSYVGTPKVTAISIPNNYPKILLMYNSQYGEEDSTLTGDIVIPVFNASGGRAFIFSDARDQYTYRSYVNPVFLIN